MVDPASGINDATIRIDAHPEKVPPGTYQATLTVDAGPLAGSKTFPVTFTVTGPGPGGPLITNVFNAASLSPGPLVAGSLAAIFGSGFAGEQVSVTFDGNVAPLLYKSATQINLQVPVALSLETSSQMVVMVDGHSSAPQAVPLAAAAPGIFKPGILNQNNTLNTAANPAARGSTIEILCTGLISPGSGAISAVIAGQNYPANWFPWARLPAFQAFSRSPWRFPLASPQARHKWRCALLPPEVSPFAACQPR